MTKTEIIDILHKKEACDEQVKNKYRICLAKDCDECEFNYKEEDIKKILAGVLKTFENEINTDAEFD